MSKKRILIISVVSLVLAIVVVLLLMDGQRIREGTPTIKVGIVLPLSGDMEQFGGNGREGLTLAKEQLEARESSRRIELVFQDSQGTPEGTVTAVRRLIDLEGAKFIIGGLTSSGVLAAAPYAQEKGVLFFSPAASADGIPEIGPLVFRNWQADTLLATMFGDLAFRKLGLRRVSILHAANDYGNTNAQSFKKSFEAAGGAVVLTRAFPRNNADYRGLIALVRSSENPDGLLIAAYPDDYKSLYLEMNVQRLEGMQRLATDTFFAPELISELGASAEGTVCAVAAKPGKDYKPRASFIDSYQARFQRQPGLVSDTAFDALWLVVSGVEATDGSPERVAKWLLEQREWQGAAGPVTFTSTGDIRGEIELFQVKEGAFVAIE